MAAVFDAILHNTPTSPQELNLVPEQLARIINKALEKDRAVRYQSAAEMRTDLNTLNREILSEALEPATQTQRIRGKRNRLWIALAAAFIAIAAIGVYAFLRREQERVPFQAMSIQRLTDVGNVQASAISPDGRYVAFAAGTVGQQSLWLRQVATQTQIQISPAQSGELFCITFSHDSNYLYYAQLHLSTGSVYRVPSLGGKPEVVLTTSLAEGVVTLSPDDKQIAFLRQEIGNQCSLVFRAIDGSAERKLATTYAPRLFGGALAWAPNGELIAANIAEYDTGKQLVITIAVRGGQQTRVPMASPSAQFISDIAWMPDNRGLILLAGATPSSYTQLWFMFYPEYRLSRITNDLESYSDPSVTSDARTLAAVQTDLVSNLYVLPNREPSRMNEITSGRKQEGYSGLTWLSNTRLAYSSMEAGKPEIWGIDLNGSHAEQLTHGVDFGTLADVRACANGRYFVTASGLPGIRRFDAGGSHMKELTSAVSDFYPSCSPDGKWVLFATFRSSAIPVIWRVPVEGGTPEPLKGYPAGLPEISPDGKWIAASDQPEPGKTRFSIIPFDGGPPVKAVDIAGATPANASWTRDGRELVYVDTQNGVSNLWAQPVSGGKPHLLTDFKSGQIFRFALSPDGKHIAVARGDQTSDVVLLIDQRVHSRD